MKYKIHPTSSGYILFQELLKSIDSLIYIDTDVLFLSNVRNLWRLFRKFNSTQLAALSPEHEEPAMGWYNRFARHPYYGQMGLFSIPSLTYKTSERFQIYFRVSAT